MNKPIKIVADRDIPYLEGVLEPYARVEYLPGERIATGDVRDAEGLIVRTRTQCGEALLAGSAIRMIVTATIGYDHIDMDYCRAHGIEVSTAAGCNARAVLQWVGGVLRHLCLSGRIGEPGRVTLGVVGVGNVGSLVARYARLWGFQVLCCDPPRERELAAGNDRGLYVPQSFVALDELARDADVVTFHVPFTRQGADATLHMAGEAFFGMLRPGAVVVNSSRGEVVDTGALKRALTAARCDCVIDTWEHEPHIDREVLSAALLATTHIAGYSVQGKANGTAMSVRALAGRFGWPLAQWYPPQAGAQRPCDISWAQMCARLPEYLDLPALTAALKADPDGFEAMRNGYRYREEFF